ncbi:MAG: hypothetical protein ACOC3I_03640, partial [Verrucomicrobiota bacterium]
MDQRILPLLAALGAAPFLSAVQTGVLVDEGYSSFFKGDLDNASLSRSGELGTAPALEEVARLSEPTVWKVIPDGEGNFIVGTGNEGKVLRISPEGESTVLFSPDALIVRGLARDGEGNLFVATSPNGAVFRLPVAGGKPELYFDPEAVYVWDLAIHDGALWMTTGMPAQLLRLPLDAGEAEDTEPSAEIIFAAKDEQLTALVRRGEEWLLGSSPRGIVYAVRDDGEAQALFKANEKEIRALGLAADDSLLIATYSDRGSGGSSSSSSSTNDPNELPPFVVSGSDGGGSSNAGGNSLNRSGGEGYLVRLDANGIARPEWRSTEGGIFSLAPIGGDHWLLGFNNDGKLYGFTSRSEWELLQQMPRGGQVSAIQAGPDGSYYIFTSNPAVLYRLGGEQSAESSFVSQVLDARQPVGWGRLETQLSAEGELHVETRSGLTDEPDSTWSDWASLEEGFIASPRGRFLQYRLRFPSSSSARFLRARAFYSMPNAAPLVSQLRVLEFGAELRTAQVNGQMIDFSAAFQEGRLRQFEGGGVERMKLERRPEQTFRTVVWRAADPNGDVLTYDVSIKRTGEPAWTLLARDLEDPSYLFNAAGFESGAYRFRVVASDASANPPESSMSAEQVSEVVLLDTTPPEIAAPTREGRTLRFAVSGDVSRVVAAQITVDGREARALRPDDGIFDSPSETFTHTL